MRLWYIISVYCLMMLVPSFKKISKKVSELLSGCDLYTKICIGAQFYTKCRWSYGTCSVRIVWYCFILLPSFAKVCHRASALRTWTVESTLGGRKCWRTDGRTDVRTDVRTDGRTNGRKTGVRGYKTFFMPNSIEHEILNAHKYKNI